MMTIEQVKRIYAPILYRKANVFGIGRGGKETRGELTGQEAITIWVTEKLPLKQIKRLDRIPPKIKGFLTDVVEVPGGFRAYEINTCPDRKNKHHPCPAGVSIGHISSNGAGTLGWYHQGHLVSNNHVLARENKAKMGDYIVQPGRLDSKTGQLEIIEKFAKLTNFVPLKIRKEKKSNPWVGVLLTLLVAIGVGWWLRKRSQSIEATPDLALAKVLNPNDIDETILEVGKPGGYGQAELGQIVRKSGRTTGVTEGTVTHLDWEGSVDYGSGKCYTTNQIIIKPTKDHKYFSRPGDSGSAFVDKDNKIVGMLRFGGGDHTGGDHCKDIQLWLKKWGL